jgi:hypothetical protein
MKAYMFVLASCATYGLIIIYQKQLSVYGMVVPMIIYLPVAWFTALAVYFVLVWS